MKLRTGWNQELLARYGRFVAERPVYFMLLPTLISVIVSAFFLRNISIFNDVTELFSATNGLYAAARPLVETKYPMNYSTVFEEGREIHFRSFGSVVVSANDGGSVLRPEVFAQAEKLDQIIQRIEFHHANKSWNFHDLCARAAGFCFRNHFFLLKPAIESIERGIYRVRFPLHLNKESWKFQFYGNVLGGVSLDEDDHIMGARSALLTYHLDPKYGPLLQMWVNTFLETLETLRVQNLTLHKFSSSSMTLEFGKDIIAVLPYFALVCSIVVGGIGFLGISRPLCWMRLFAGAISMLSTGITVATAFSLCSAFGINFTVVNFVLPFFSLGVSLCDTLAQIGAWQDTDSTLDIGRRMSEVYRRTAVPSAALAFCSISLYLIALHLVPMRAVFYFTQYALAVMAFNFLHQHTYVTGFLAFCAQLEERGKMPICFRRKTCSTYSAAPTSETPEKFPNFQLPQVAKETPLAKLANISRKLKISKNTAPCLKIVTIAMLLALTGACFWLMLNNPDDFEATYNFKYDSYVYRYWDIVQRDIYYSLFRFQLIIDTPLDFSNMSVQAQVEEMMGQIESLQYMDKPYVTESWLRYFHFFLQDKRSFFLTRPYNLEEPRGFLRCLYDVFFRLPPTKRFLVDLIPNSEMTAIESSRYLLQCRGIRGMTDLQRLFNNISTIASRYPFKVYLYHPFLGIFEVSKILRDTFPQHISLCCLAVVVVMFLFTFDCKRSLFVGVTFAINAVISVGLSSFAGIRYNPISVISWVITMSFHASGAIYLLHHLDGQSKMTSSFFNFFESPVVLIFSVMMIGILTLPFRMSTICETFLSISVLSLCVNILTFKIISVCLKDYWKRPYVALRSHVNGKESNIDLEKKLAPSN